MLIHLSINLEEKFISEIQFQLDYDLNVKVYYQIIRNLKINIVAMLGHERTFSKITKL